MNLTQETVESRILEMIAEVSPANRDLISIDADFATLRLDSVASMELVSMICDEFDIDVEIEEAFAVTTVRGAVDMTLRTLAGTPRPQA